MCSPVLLNIYTRSLITNITCLYEFSLRNCQDTMRPRLLYKPAQGKHNLALTIPKLGLYGKLGSIFMGNQKEITLSQSSESQTSFMKMVSVYGPCNPVFKAVQKLQPLWKDYVGPVCTLFLFYMLQAFRKSYQSIAGSV